jgi:hypothetical protein
MKVARETERWRPALAGLLLAALLTAVLGPSVWDGSARAAAGGVPAPKPYTGPPIDTSNADRCDFLDPAVCLQPWPNDYFTVPDRSTDTGRRLSLRAASMPANKLGAHIDPAEYNRADGFSPGSLITVRVPGLDNPRAFANTGAVSVDQMERYSDQDQPVVLIDAATGRRQPIWTEIDYNPIDPAVGGSPDDPADRAKVNLLIRPAVNLEEGGRYIVALRHLRDSGGRLIQPSDAFRVYRDNLITAQPAVEARRPHMEQLFGSLRSAGIGRSNLYLAWDFTVASERSLTARMLRIRDDAFAQLGDTNLSDLRVQGRAPAFSIDSSQTESFSRAQNAHIGRIVHGTVTVPCYMNTPGCSPAGSTYNYGADGLPSQLLGGTPLANTASVPFECIVPHSALDDPSHAPARVSLYGHGLLGSASEVEGGNVEAMADEHEIVFCATDWYGFATQNIPNVLLILQNLSLFPLLADETQQGMLNFLYLGRLMIHPDGLGSDPAFQDAGGNPIIRGDRLFYDGNSQGGILGGALTAVAPDFDRAVLGVPGMNYSTLLQRSVDFEPYAEGKFTSEVCGLFPSPLDSVCAAAPEDTPLGLYDNYPNELERPLIFSLMQLLWDRAEADGYAHHMTSDPLPNTPPHSVLLHAAFGDHQVANVAAEVEARTIGARVYQPALDPGRHWNPNGIFGIPAVVSFPYSGSALVYWDGGPVGFPGGTATPPNEDIPPRPPAYGADPHSYPRNDVKARAQKSDFLQIGGVLNNYCTTANRPDPAPSLLVPNSGTAIPCHSHGWTGP